MACTASIRTNDSICLPNEALHALELIEENGFEAWIVGGFVRDALLKRPCYDIDIATSAPWTIVRSIFADAGYGTHETGVQHGTITVVVNGTAFEITTYRNDGIYSDGRRPDTVEFVSSIQEDLARRDFTVNALAYHPERGLLDLYNGIDDLEARIIRAVGNPEKRFKEDSLRILRACRFASQLGFTIEDTTFNAAMACKHLLPRLAAERVRHELDGLLRGTHVHDALMETVDILSMVLPELVAMKGFDQKTPYHIYDVLEHTAWVVQHSPATTLSRWTALFHDMGKPAAFFTDEEGVGHFYGHANASQVFARSIMGRLGFSRTFQERVLAIVKHHDDVIEPTPKAVKRALSRFHGDLYLFTALCAIKRADALSQAPCCAERVLLADELERIAAEVVAADEAFTLKKLAVNGNDLRNAGMIPSPAMGELLQEMLEAVIDERLANEKDALLKYASQHGAFE